MTSKAHIARLQEVPVFGGVSESTLNFLLAHSTQHSAAADEYFCREHESATSMFVLESGRAAVTKCWRGQDYLIHHLEAGDCFGEMALMDLCPRSASVITEVPCRVIEIAADTLGELYNRDAEQFTLIMMNLGREMCRRLRDSDERLFNETMRMGIAERRSIHLKH